MLAEHLVQHAFAAVGEQHVVTGGQGSEIELIVSGADLLNRQIEQSTAQGQGTEAGGLLVTAKLNIQLAGLGYKVAVRGCTSATAVGAAAFRVMVVLFH